MDYPIWALPAKNLLIAFVAVVHVFISHFAVGGGLFLVLAEKKARREQDEALLGYVKRHSRFFILLTLVSGAITGVGIWFTIGLVHPAATSALINTFVWAWAIEWTFFVTEIAAAMVYFYGWDRLPAKTHLAVGWIYFWSAWLSLVAINGILSFMLTPGEWLTTRGFWEGLINPTYFSSLVMRTLAAVVLAGLYALLTAAALRDAALKAKVVRYAAWWILPSALALPLTLAWYLVAAEGAGVAVGEVLGATSPGLGPMLATVWSGSSSGYTVAIVAVRLAVIAAVAVLIGTLFITRFRSRTYGYPSAAVVMVFGFLVVGGAEWAREDLRKPYVIGNYMFVNGVRLPAASGVPVPPAGAGEDRFTIEAVSKAGLLSSTPFVRLASSHADQPRDEARVDAEGREVFRLLCSQCHTVDGYLAIRPLVQGKGQAALETMIGKLAEPHGGQVWSDPALVLRTWRGRRMPPFAGNDQEKAALALYLAKLGGSPVTLEKPSATSAGQSYFDANCAACHGPGADFPIGARGRTAEQLYEMLGRLQAVNEMMPPFEGTEAERRAVADYLATLQGAANRGGAR